MGRLKDLKEEYKHLRDCLYMDQSCGSKGSRWFLIRALWNPCYSVLYSFRLGGFFRKHKILFAIPYIFVFLFHRYNMYKTGIQLEFGTRIGEGLTFAHWGAIIINPQAVIGKNCLIYQGVTIGSQRGGQKSGAPIIGDNCILSSGSKIIGGVTLGDNVVVGANAVVTKSFPSGSVVAGVPAKIINENAIEIIHNYLSF